MKAKIFLLAAAITTLAIWPAFAYDANDDGMSDIFADYYGLSQNSANEDEDGDGFTNLEESKWGTNPTEETRTFTSMVPYSSNVFVFSFDSIEGKKYLIEFTDDLTTSWTGLGNIQPGNGNTIAFGTQVVGDKGFWRLAHMGEADFDADGLSLYEEGILQTLDTAKDTDGDYILDVNEYLAGTPPDVVDTPPAVVFAPISGDYTTAQSIELQNLALPNYIYYTTDGSEPTLFSQKYVAEFPISTGADALLNLRAKVILPNGAESAESSATYRVGTYTDTPQTVYYGWVTANAGMGYAYNVSELTTVTNLYAPKTYLTLGFGWIINSHFEPDLTAVSQPLYYGLTRTFVGVTDQPIEGYTTDASTFYTGANFHNYRAVGSGWITAFDRVEPDIENTASQTIYLVSLSFSLSSSSGSYPRWLYTTENTDQWGHSSPSGYVYPLAACRTGGFLLRLSTFDKYSATHSPMRLEGA